MAFEFDNIINAECQPGNPGDEDAGTCSTQPPVPPSVDDRCADPAFYAANPELCAGYPILILKPEFAITTPGGTIQYKTYLRASGDETEITNGLTYSTADSSKAVIEASGGLLTGVSEGITAVSVTWQNLQAFAQVQVVETCSEQVANFVIVIDNSQSSGVAFSSSYATRLSYAKEAAARFVESVNLAKDKVAIAYFNESGTLVLALASSEESALAAIASIPLTSAKTSIYSGLKTATDHLASASGIKCVILFSDGENNQGNDPVAFANSWKDVGKIVIGVALRSWGLYFDAMYRIASAGYFLSAYGDTEDDVISILTGLKTFICSGDCQPAEGAYPVAELNYTGFVNWDVFQGSVDLVGLDQWDVQPGHGLYVDLAGTYDPASGVFVTTPGGIRTKTAFSFVSGTDYRFSLKVAGNNVGVLDNVDPVRVKIISEDGLTTYLDETITPTAGDMPFTEYEFEFTAAATKDAKISIEMVGSTNTNVGPLIDDILLEDVTTPATIFEDDFDDENETTVEGGYSYYGCLETPPSAQAADPNPPTPPIEG